VCLNLEEAADNSKPEKALENKIGVGVEGGMGIRLRGQWGIGYSASII
jgi:hypothetical protein